jgi:hypothetical protein
MMFADMLGDVLCWFRTGHRDSKTVYITTTLTQPVAVLVCQDCGHTTYRRIVEADCG